MLLVSILFSSVFLIFEGAIRDNDLFWNESKHNDSTVYILCKDD